MEAWDSYLRERFPGYLLPDAAHHRLSEQEASKFLESIAGRKNALPVLRAVSLLVPRIESLTVLTRDVLPSLVRKLPSRTETHERRWEGGFHGRLQIAQTQALHLAGQRASFVTRERVRSFDLPENLLVRALCVRLVEAVVFLREERVLPDKGWGPGLRDVEARLRHLLHATALREVSDAAVTSVHENAARFARAPEYHACATWWRDTWDGLDNPDPTVIARLVAEGALLPASEPTQFELAVLIRLTEALHIRLEEKEPGRWVLERALIISDRDDAFTLRRADGCAVRIYYNQAVLPEGPINAGTRHYLGIVGRMRPDVTVVFARDGVMTDALVIECKLSSDPSYVRSGYHEAMLYAAEYAPWLTGCPKSLLVASSTVVGSHREQDEVVAFAWEQWPSERLLSQLASRACWG